MRYRVPSEMTTMATLLLTPDCDRPFPSALRRERGCPALPGQSWSWENLIYLADFLWASNQRQVSLGGGEPTLHPECVDFILYLLQRGFEVTVFTTWGGKFAPTRGVQAPSHRGAHRAAHLGM